MMTDWRDEFDRAIIDRNKAVRDAIEWKARAEAAESELSKYRQWHEQAQIRAVDAEFELAQFMDDMIACLGLPDREYGDSVGEVIVAAVTKIIARAEAAEKRVAELEAAQAWRPVTETEPAYGETVLFWYSGIKYAEPLRRAIQKGGDVWEDSSGVTFYISNPEDTDVRWYPLPPPPTGDKPY